MGINQSINLSKEILSLDNVTFQKPGFKIEELAGIPTSNQLTGITLMAKNILIKDNDVTWVWPVVRYADLYVICVVMDDISKEPATVKIEGFEKIDDGDILPFERTIYYWRQKNEEESPGQIHSIVQVIKSNEGIRMFGKALSDLKQSTEYKSVINQVVANIATGGTAELIQESVSLVTGLLGSILGNVSDTPLITDVKSYTNLNGDFDQLGKIEIPSKHRSRFVDVDYTLTVRDSNREGNLGSN